MRALGARGRLVDRSSWPPAPTLARAERRVAYLNGQHTLLTIFTGACLVGQLNWPAPTQ